MSNAVEPYVAPCWSTTTRLDENCSTLFGRLFRTKTPPHCGCSKRKSSLIISEYDCVIDGIFNSVAEIDKRRPRTGKAQRDPHEVHGRGSFPLAAAAPPSFRLRRDRDAPARHVRVHLQPGPPGQSGLRPGRDCLDDPAGAGCQNFHGLKMRLWFFSTAARGTLCLHGRPHRIFTAERWCGARVSR